MGEIQYRSVVVVLTLFLTMVDSPDHFSGTASRYGSLVRTPPFQLGNNSLTYELSGSLARRFSRRSPVRRPHCAPRCLCSVDSRMSAVERLLRLLGPIPSPSGDDGITWDGANDIGRAWSRIEVWCSLVSLESPRCLPIDSTLFSELSDSFALHIRVRRVVMRRCLHERSLRLHGLGRMRRI